MLRRRQVGTEGKNAEDRLAKAGEESGELPLCDLDKLREKTLGDPAFLAELVATFDEDRPGHFENIRNAIRRGDGDALTLAAHALLGSLRILEAPRASILTRRIEQLGEAGDFEGALRSLGPLEDESRRLVAFLIRAVEQESPPA